MRYAIALCIVLAIFAPALNGQKSNGYVFFAPGGVSCCGYTAMTLQVGVGGEAVLGKGIGIGAEVGALGVKEDLIDTTVGVFSPNGYYHFVHREGAKADPFVTGGYTMYFRWGHENAFNFGGGLNYWFHRHLGARLEFRDQVQTMLSGVHSWGFRFGLAFR